MSKLKYFISTFTGQIPNIVGDSEFKSLKMDLVLYLDDFVYKDSLYESKEVQISLKDLCCIEETTKILLAFRNTPKLLISKRGNYKLTQQKFNELLEIMKPDFYVDYLSQDLIDGATGDKLKHKFVDPKSLDEFKAVINSPNVFIGTTFINEITKSKKMLRVDAGELKEDEPFDCTCCGQL